QLAALSRSPAEHVVLDEPAGKGSHRWADVDEPEAVAGVLPSGLDVDPLWPSGRPRVAVAELQLGAAAPAVPDVVRRPRARRVQPRTDVVHPDADVHAVGAAVADVGLQVHESVAGLAERVAPPAIREAVLRDRARVRRPRRHLGEA